MSFDEDVFQFVDCVDVLAFGQTAKLDIVEIIHTFYWGYQPRRWNDHAEIEKGIFGYLRERSFGSGKCA